MNETLRLIFSFCTRALGLMGSLNPSIRSLLMLGSVVLALWDWVNDLWSYLFYKIDSLVMPAMQSVGVDVSPLGLLNYVLPIDTLFTMITAYAALRATGVLIRIVKSFIPTISG